MHIVTYVTDLFFLVRIKDVAQRLGATVTVLPRKEDSVERIEKLRPQWLLVDLAQEPATWVPLIHAAKAVEAKVLAFGPHHDLQRRRMALETGADLVVPNSRFSQELPRLLQRWSERSVAGTPQGEAAPVSQQGEGGDGTTP